MSAIVSARQTLLILLPEFLILVSATVMITAGAFVKRPRNFWSIASAATLLVSLLTLVLLRDQVTDPYGSVALNDAMSGYGRLVFLLTGFIVLAMAHDQVDDARAPEFFGSLLLINAGAMLVCTANELVFLFVGLELISMPTYLLLYLSRRNTSTQEAATKYFFLSIFSSGRQGDRQCRRQEAARKSSEASQRNPCRHPRRGGFFKNGGVNCIVIPGRRKTATRNP